MTSDQPVKLSAVDLELQPVRDPAESRRGHPGQFDLSDFERPRADMTAVHPPLMTFEDSSDGAEVSKGLQLPETDDGKHPGLSVAEGGGVTAGSEAADGMNDEALAWKLWREENEAMKEEQRTAPGRYHREDEELARALQEEFNQEGEVMCFLIVVFQQGARNTGLYAKVR